MTATSAEMTLQTLIGPYGGWFHVGHGATGSNSTTIGRAVDSDICLLHETVSRHHASLVVRAGDWFLVDAGTPAGTFVNGVRLEPHSPTPLTGADLVRIGPWTFRVVLGSMPAVGPATHDDDDAILRPQRSTSGVAPVATYRLRLLSECLAELGGAANEEDMARIALGVALEGSGFKRGAMLRPLDSPDPSRHELSVVAAIRMGPLTDRERRFGRAILEAAWSTAETGRAVALSGDLTPVPAGHTDLPRSILCAPVLLGRTLVSFLYLDARGAEALVQGDAAEFVEAVAAAYGLALANLRRLELDRRQQSLAAELHSARDAQQFILPPHEGELRFVRYAMRMTPGLFVAGDLFDVVPLPKGRVAFFLGDVAGHGAGSAMLMASTQSHLHADLRDGRSPAEAVNSINSYLAGRTMGGRFVSLWVAIFDSAGHVEYVDAGHSHWFHIPSGTGANERESGIPVGIDPGHTYIAHSITLAPRDRIVVYTDGLVEQRRSGGSEFGAQRLAETIRKSHTPADDVRLAFESMLSFTGAPTLADDATAASIEYLGNKDPA